MSSNSGMHMSYTLFGESHGPAIGITITGIPAGIILSLEKITEKLVARQGGAVFNTPRQEAPIFEIISGFFAGQTTGTPLTVIFKNETVKSKDYTQFVKQPRPGHADSVAAMKYKDAQDYRGGGHFSGRLTTPIVFFGEVARQCIVQHNTRYQVVSSIVDFGGIHAPTYHDIRRNALAATFNLTENKTVSVGELLEENKQTEIVKQTNIAVASVHETYQMLDTSFPVHGADKKQAMEEAAIQARIKKDSLGGAIETIVMHPPLAIGEPFFHSVESIISGLLFSIGSVKGVTFGYGTTFANTFGSQCKDEIIALNNKNITTLYNYNGGINGGITNGEDIVFQSILKPIASILQEQHTLNLETNTIESLEIKGRHDATIINRVLPVIEAVTHIAILDLLLVKNTHV